MRFKIFSAVCLLALVGTFQAQAGIDKEEFSRKIYEQISGPAETLTRYQDGQVIVGVHVEQKTEDANSFCRATTPVYPGAKATHACYGLLMDGDDARATYENSPRSATNVLFSINGQTRVGGAWNEKLVQDSQSGTALLCVKTHAVVPNPVPTYRCFHELVPIGGGASIGN